MSSVNKTTAAAKPAKKTSPAKEKITEGEVLLEKKQKEKQKEKTVPFRFEKVDPKKFLAEPSDIQSELQALTQYFPGCLETKAHSFSDKTEGQILKEFFSRMGEKKYELTSSKKLLSFLPESMKRSHLDERLIKDVRALNSRYCSERFDIAGVRAYSNRVAAIEVGDFMGENPCQYFSHKKVEIDSLLASFRSRTPSGLLSLTSDASYTPHQYLNQGITWCCYNIQAIGHCPLSSTSSFFSDASASARISLSSSVISALLVREELIRTWVLGSSGKNINSEPILTVQSGIHNFFRHRFSNLSVRFLNYDPVIPGIMECFTFFLKPSLSYNGSSDVGFFVNIWINVIPSGLTSQITSPIYKWGGIGVLIDSLILRRFGIGVNLFGNAELKVNIKDKEINVGHLFRMLTRGDSLKASNKNAGLPKIGRESYSYKYVPSFSSTAGFMSEVSKIGRYSIRPYQPLGPLRSDYINAIFCDSVFAEDLLSDVQELKESEHPLLKSNIAFLEKILKNADGGTSEFFYRRRSLAPPSVLQYNEKVGGGQNHTLNVVMKNKEIRPFVEEYFSNLIQESAGVPTEEDLKVLEALALHSE